VYESETKSEIPSKTSSEEPKLMTTTEEYESETKPRINISITSPKSTDSYETEATDKSSVELVSTTLSSEKKVVTEKPISSTIVDFITSKVSEILSTTMSSIYETKTEETKSESSTTPTRIEGLPSEEKSKTPESLGTTIYEDLTQTTKAKPTVVTSSVSYSTSSTSEIPKTESPIERETTEKVETIVSTSSVTPEASKAEDESVDLLSTTAPKEEEEVVTTFAKLNISSTADSYLRENVSESSLETTTQELFTTSKPKIVVTTDEIPELSKTTIIEKLESQTTLKPTEIALNASKKISEDITTTISDDMISKSTTTEQTLTVKTESPETPLVSEETTIPKKTDFISTIKTTVSSVDISSSSGTSDTQYTTTTDDLLVTSEKSTIKSSTSTESYTSRVEELYPSTKSDQLNVTSDKPTTITSEISHSTPDHSEALLTTIQDKEVLKFETTSTERPTAEHLTTIGSELIKNETVGKETISPTDYSTTASIISSTVPSDSTLISITESPILRNISIAEDLKKEDNISVSTQPTTVSKIDKLFDELTTESTFNMSSTEKFTTDESHISTQKSIDLSSTEAYVTNVSDISSTTLEEEGGWTYLRPINKTTSVKPNLTTVSPITEEYPIQNLTTKIVTIMSTTKAFEDESTLSPTTMSDKSIEDSSTKSVDRAETSAADDFVTLMSTTSKPLIRFVPVDISQTTSYSRESVTHSLPTRTTISTSSPSPSTLSSIKEFTTLSQTTSTAESKKTTPIPSTIASITTTGIYTEIEEGGNFQIMNNY
jgi:hypothetical protein